MLQLKIMAAGLWHTLKPDHNDTRAVSRYNPNWWHQSCDTLETKLMAPDLRYATTQNDGSRSVTHAEARSRWHQGCDTLQPELMALELWHSRNQTDGTRAAICYNWKSWQPVFDTRLAPAVRMSTSSVNSAHANSCRHQCLQVQCGLQHIHSTIFLPEFLSGSSKEQTQIILPVQVFCWFAKESHSMISADSFLRSEWNLLLGRWIFSRCCLIYSFNKHTYTVMTVMTRGTCSTLQSLTRRLVRRPSLNVLGERFNLCTKLCRKMWPDQ
jgi:hypothetical protein